MWVSPIAVLIDGRYRLTYHYHAQDRLIVCIGFLLLDILDQFLFRYRYCGKCGRVFRGIYIIIVQT